MRGTVIRQIAAILLCLSMAPVAGAFEPFVVRDIELQGLQRISEGTVFNYLPVSVGDRLSQETASQAIRALYETGFFQDVTLRREDDTLLVALIERPAVSNLTLHGNSELPSDKLKTALKDVGLSEGRVFNRSLLNTVERELKLQYYSLGYYDVEVESTVSPLPRNRVSIRIDIAEGEPASIQEIHLTGNESFDADTLREQFELGPRAWWSLFGTSDRYSRQRLGGDLENLRSFYLNRGYINYDVTSTQVSIDPRRREIFIGVNLSEGNQYSIGEVKLAGEFVVPEAELRDLATVSGGELYSRQEVTATSEAIKARLGEEGYAFANVNPVPDVDEQNKTVDLTFFVDPAERVYVRRVNITGNEQTQDRVIRRELRQMEGGWLSTENVKQSRRRLNRLGFFEQVNIETPRVPGSDDQVDVDVNVTERLSGSLQAGVGYGSDRGLILNMSVQQDNVLGSGDRVSVSASDDDVTTIYSLSYTERYASIDGVSRTYSAVYRKTRADAAYISNYRIDQSRLGIEYGIPLEEEEEIRIGVQYENLGINLGDEANDEQLAFVDENGENIDQFVGTLSWVIDSRDRAIFPTSGGRQSIGGEGSIPGGEVGYYRLNYSHQRYFGLTESLTWILDGALGYGEGYGDTERLPFYERYFAGGISSVRGYRSNSLGQRDQFDNPLGGNFRVVGGTALQFPVPFADVSSMRLSWFVDGGYVYDTMNQDVSLGEMRYSSGVALNWYSPLGPLTLSWAQPLNEREGDKTELFQFSIGAVF
ncbi:outer membrane protein assembly factor BamA [Ectothiorhodospiraceae bacterium WFHF3C12]|nr:outer membrane protein assembly factor BamA [Ectothiorhodospiraceae bacterium WFHF3C12]